MAESSTEPKVIKIGLKSSDGVIIEVDKDVAIRSTVVKNMLEDLGDEDAAERPIPLHKVSEAVLKKIVEWCVHHRADPLPVGDSNGGESNGAAGAAANDNRKRTTDIEEWDQKFMQVDQEMLFEIIVAANYMDIQQLLDVGCKTVANMIKGKSPEEIRKTFNITNDFTQEEEEQIRRENEWAEDR